MSLLCICPPSCYKEANCLDMLICQHEIVKYFMWVFSLPPLDNLEIWKHLLFSAQLQYDPDSPGRLYKIVCTHTHTHTHTEASQVALVVKNPPSMQKKEETQVQSLGWEDPLEEGMAIHSRILAWEIPWTKEPGRLQSIGSQGVRYYWNDLLSTHVQTHTNTCSSLGSSPMKCL